MFGPRSQSVNDSFAGVHIVRAEMLRCGCTTQRNARVRGFTLVEILMTTLLLAVAFTALLFATQHSTRGNALVSDMLVATMLADEVREWTAHLPLNDPFPGQSSPSPQAYVDHVMALNNVTYDPPRSALGAPPIAASVSESQISNMPGWSQRITVQWRNPQDVTQAATDTPSSVAYVTVDIRRDGETIYTTGWIEAD